MVSKSVIMVKCEWVQDMLDGFTLVMKHKVVLNIGLSVFQLLIALFGPIIFHGG